MIVDVLKLDHYLKFLHDEAEWLRKHHPSLPWAEAKMKKLEGIAEVLRQLRQDKQMATVGGKRIEG